MPNLVEIKTEIFEDFDNTIEEGVSPGSPTTHHDELDVQDDLEHAEAEQQNSQPNHIEEGKTCVSFAKKSYFNQTNYYYSNQFVKC